MCCVRYDFNFTVTVPVSSVFKFSVYQGMHTVSVVQPICIHVAVD